MITSITEKRLLQITVSIACLVPISAGLYGIIYGTGWLGSTSADLDGHFRYLSGLLLGIGLAFLSTVPHIERHNARFKLLTFIVCVGGFARLASLILGIVPSPLMLFALGMELVITPALYLWQRRIMIIPKH